MLFRSDGMAVIVNANSPIANLTLRQVEQIFTGDVTDWSAVGGRPGKISVYTRNTSSGTYSDWKDLAMKKRDYAKSSQKMAGNEQIAAEVAKNPNGIGYVGLAYINAAGIKGLVRSFIGTVAANGRARDLPAMAAGYLAELARRRGETTASVTSAVPLTAAQQQQLTDTLRSILGAKVAIDAQVNPDILGGLVVKVGSRLFDSSIRSKLARLQLAMKGVA